MYTKTLEEEEDIIAEIIQDGRRFTGELIFAMVHGHSYNLAYNNNNNVFGRLVCSFVCVAFAEYGNVISSDRTTNTTWVCWKM